MEIGIVSLFPDMFAALDYGITGRAQELGLVHLSYWNPRDETTDPHRTVDDRPYGGGPGMLMKVQPLRAAINKAKNQLGEQTKVIYLTPQGRKLDQASVKKLSQQTALILVAGRYEGIDERLVNSEIDEEWSIGDYILSGGEIAAMVLIDSVTRLQPGALGQEQSAVQDSFSNGLLDYPHYTRPAEIDGMKVPEVLMSGDHLAIERWRMQQALGRTWLRRPELINQLQLTAEQQVLLDEFISKCTVD